MPALDWLLGTRPLTALELGYGFRGFAAFGKDTARAQAEEAMSLLGDLEMADLGPAARRLRLLLGRAVRRAEAPSHGPEDPAAPMEDLILALIGCDLREGMEEERRKLLAALPEYLGGAGAALSHAHPPRAFLELGIQLGSAASGLLLARGDLEEGGPPEARGAAEALTRYVAELSKLRARATGDPSAGISHLRSVLISEGGTTKDPKRLLQEAEEDLQAAFDAAQAAAERIAPEADWMEVLEGLGQDHPENGEELLEAYGEALRETGAAARGVFPEAPGGALSVRQVPVHLQHLVSFIGYLPPGMPGGSEPALLVAQAPGQLMEVHCRRRLPLHAAREGVPGSHLLHTVVQGDLGYRLALSPCFGQAYAEYAAEEIAGRLGDPGVELVAALAMARRAAMAAADIGLQSRMMPVERVERELSEVLGLSGPAAEYQFAQLARRPGESACVWVLARSMKERVEAAERAGRSAQEAHIEIFSEWPFSEGE